MKRSTGIDTMSSSQNGFDTDIWEMLGVNNSSFSAKKSKNSSDDLLEASQMLFGESMDLEDDKGPFLKNEPTYSSVGMSSQQDPILAEIQEELEQQEQQDPILAEIQEELEELVEQEQQEQQENCGDCTWTYSPGMKTCTKCSREVPCEHADTGFNLTHRVCSDCGIVFFGMRLAHEPPRRVVYNRNLRTGRKADSSPIINVGHNGMDHWDWKSVIRNFHVDVTLLEDKTFEEFDNSQGKFMSGTCRYTLEQADIFNPKNILFKDLKVLHTSQQKKTTSNGRETKDNDYILQWTLTANYFDDSKKKFAVIRSQPFTVYSHSKQVKIEEETSKCNPTIEKVFQQKYELIENTDIALFGNNFFADKTSMKIGTTITVPFTRHNNGAGFITLNKNVIDQIRKKTKDRKEVSFPIFACNTGNTGDSGKEEYVKTDGSVIFSNTVTKPFFAGSSSIGGGDILSGFTFDNAPNPSNNTFK